MAARWTTTSLDALVAYLRSWEQEAAGGTSAGGGNSCGGGGSAHRGRSLWRCVRQCHGPKGEGGIGPALSDPKFQSETTDQEIFDTISKGHKSTPMIAWGDVLTSDQIQQLVDFIRQFKQQSSSTPAPTSASTSTPAPAPAPTSTPAVAGPVSFAKDVLPIFQAKCAVCHGNLGGWNAKSYDTVMKSGDHAPTVVAGDSQGSLLAQKIQGTQTKGTVMPPNGKLTADEIKTILDWITAGAPDN